MFLNRDKSKTIPPRPAQSSSPAESEAQHAESLPIRVRHLLRDYGLRKGLARLFSGAWNRVARFVYSKDKYWLLSFSLETQPIPEFSLGENYEIHELQDWNIADTAVLWDSAHVDYKLKEYRKRIETGATGYVVRHRGKVIAAAWMTIRRQHEKFLGVTINLGPGVCYGYDGFVHPDYRGHGIFTGLLVHVLREWRQRGYRKRVVLAHEDNRAVLHPCVDKVGQTIIGELNVRRILGLSRPEWTINGICQKSSELEVPN